MYLRDIGNQSLTGKIKVLISFVIYILREGSYVCFSQELSDMMNRCDEHSIFPRPKTERETRPYAGGVSRYAKRA